MGGIVEDFDLGFEQLGGATEGLVGAGVAGVARMGAACDDDAEAMLARHRAECPQFSAAVYLDGEVLAEYEAECPAELRDILAVGE